jgi:hypothetical protein
MFVTFVTYIRILQLIIYFVIIKNYVCLLLYLTILKKKYELHIPFTFSYLTSPYYIRFPRMECLKVSDCL